jgi:ataxia telangiectasia mutated family protein
MSTSNIRDILELVRDSKVKARTEGLASLRKTFENPKAVRNFDLAGDGRPWLVVFQALFTAVGTERAAVLASKKSTSPADKRLVDAAATMRALVERSAPRLNKKVVKALLAHLLPTMVNSGALIQLVALDYIKAVRALLAWQPHLDHLDEPLWVDLAERAFNIVLGDNLRTRLDEEPEPDTPAPDEDEEDADSMVEGATPRKRRFASATPGPSSPRKPRQPPPRRAVPVSLEQIECAALLSRLLASPSAPLLAPAHAYLPRAILNRLARFLHAFPPDSSLHHDLLRALAAALGHLALNCRAATATFAADAWDALVGLWGARTRGTREHLVTIFLTLLPFYTTAPDLHGAARDGVGALWATLEDARDVRKGMDCLDPDALRLDIIPATETLASFRRRTFAAGDGFDAGHALTWATLTLHADCIAQVRHRLPLLCPC